MRSTVRPFAAAHRGLSAVHPENTIEAFQAAVIAGFRALEMDLQTTRDGEVVILHDPGIERTTNGNGRVADMAYDELRTYQTQAGPVPRLDDLMADLAEWRGLWNLELKSRSATEGTLRLIEHHRLGNRAQVTSMDLRALETARDRMPDLSRGLIILGPPDLEELQAAKELGCTWVNCDHEYLSKEVTESVRMQGLRIGAWTVNDPDRANILADWGVECVITDTREVLSALAKRAEPKPYF